MRARGSCSRSDSRTIAYAFAWRKSQGKSATTVIASRCALGLDRETAPTAGQVKPFAAHDGISHSRDDLP